uniref:RNase H type-1 domain-containing protein n=1 Tax=Cacopsylla melanoneura TaxID=428564 RepID=A0A8D8WXT1_9HEMI
MTEKLQLSKSPFEHLMCRLHQFQKIVILSDSKAAIQAIVNLNDSPSIQIREIRTTIKQLGKLNKLIALQWIPSHCGLHGNEKADYLAKYVVKRNPNHEHICL